MAFNLTDFIGAHKDFSRGYTFYFLPPTDQGFGGNDRYLVMSSVLPASTITQAEANWQGNIYKVATTHEYAEFTVSFHCDPSDSIRHKFVDWANRIHNRISNLHGAPGDYMSDFELQHISHTTGAPIMEYKFKHGWPSNVGELSLDYGAKEIATFDVTFVYQWFETSTGNATGATATGATTA